ncbi:MAG: hypothetical protein HC866_19610 [Leptolyngbyaceae cyanobacterium RU_5_1]|nr:hypothetical protein [Leptolyngbyaceae cyanobacterium RU_5_1]
MTTEYPFIDKHQACAILNCSESTLRRRMKTDLHKDIHWVQRNKHEAIKFNQRLLEDYLAHLGDPSAHLPAIEAYTAYLKRNQPKRRGRGVA